MRSVAFVQARTGSTRFPGKVFATFKGVPMIWHVIARAKEAVGNVYLLVPYGERSLFCGHDAPVLEGPEDDVLSRFLLAADLLDLEPSDIIVRITADDPLKQPELIRAAVWHAQRNEYADTNHAPGLEGWGAEAFTVRWLRDLAMSDPPDKAREHVTNWRRTPVACSATVDTPEDLGQLEAMCAGW